MTARVSVIMPIHNAAPTVERALRSLIAQTEARWEAIVVNDGSTDRGEAVVRAMTKADHRIRILSQECRGAGAARNRGLEASGGDYIWFLDADDWLEPDALSHLTSAARATGAACGLCRMCDAKERPLRWPQPLSTREDIGLQDLLSSEAFAIHAQVIRRDLIGDVRFRTDLKSVEDLDFFLRLAERGVRWRKVPHVAGWYRLRARLRATREFAAGFGDMKRVIEDGFARAGAVARGRGAPSLESVIRTRALHYATMMILQDRTNELAASVIQGISPRPEFTPEEMARAAHCYVPLSEETGLDAWRDHIDRYSAALHSWWGRCAREGWTGLDDVGGIVPALSRLIANDLDIPSMLADRITPDRPVVLLGLGTNGVRLAEVLAHRRVPFAVRDDGLDEKGVEARLPGLEIPLISPDQPFDPGEQHIMTLLDDAAFMRKLPRGLAVSRWATCVEEVALVTRSKLMAGRMVTPEAA